MAASNSVMGYIDAARPGRARLLMPGLGLLTPGTQRYRIKGGGALVIAVEAGDDLTLVDLEGLQAAELVPFDSQGRADPGLLDKTASAAPQGLLALLAEESDPAGDLRAKLARRGIALSHAKALCLLEGETVPGHEAAITVTKPGFVVVVAPGAAMQVDAQNPPTDLRVFVKKATWDPDQSPPLPDPLADPRMDIRVHRATAEAYQVKAGEYIQVIDVAGRECSDFQCFDQRKLDQGRENALDPTTTRTLLGAAYPGPGLASKFFDQDQQPLIEVIQDTVGRHDTFGLACTARYYDDVGYPGHVNCSENFNYALKDMGVAPRAGWPALNVFYNTGINDNNGYVLDEPWSRPGDYVLLRALTDLTCVSSACPDDISGANGWNPSDIHLRIYSPDKLFKKAVAFRMTSDSEAELTRETAFHSRTSTLTRDFVDYNGFWLPNSFTGLGPEAEYWACREKAVALDLSALRKFEVLGPDAETLMQYALTRNVRTMAAGQVLYSAMCYDTGGMIDDGTLFRLGPDNFRWIGGSDFGGIWLRQLAEKMGLRVWIKSSTDHLHNISVQGPKSREILKDFVWTAPKQASMDELGWFRFSVARIGDHNGIPILVSRTGYTGELGYEVWCHPKHGSEVWDAIWQAGEPHGLAPMGLAALDILRIEAGLIFASYEFSDQTDPYEAGIGFAVALKGTDEDFCGRKAIEERKAHPQRKLVGLELEGHETAHHGDCVRVGRNQVGVITSGCRSPILKKNIALCRMDIAYADVGAEVEVGKMDGQQKRIPATVVPFPFYDPKKERVRA